MSSWNGSSRSPDWGKQPYVFVNNHNWLVLVMVWSLLETHRWREMALPVRATPPPFSWILLLLFSATAVFNKTHTHTKEWELCDGWTSSRISVFIFFSLRCYADHFFLMQEGLKPWAAYIIFFPKVTLNFCTNRNDSCCAYQKFIPSHTTKSYVWPDSVGEKITNHFNL